MPMPFFRKWCQDEQEVNTNKALWKLSELPGAREKVSKALVKTARSHYDDLGRIADDMKRNGFKQAGKVLEARLPKTKKARSGDLGEILATEFVQEYLDYLVPVRRLRYKDGREMALRGDDFIGISKNPKNDLRLIKGESKSRVTLTSTTLQEARNALNKNHGRCTPASLYFVADRLMDGGGEEDVIGKILRAEVGAKSLPPDKITHVLFTLSGNMPLANLEADLRTCGRKRPQILVNLHIPDHQEFIKQTFKKIIDLGNS